MEQTATAAYIQLKSYDDFKTPTLASDKWITAKLPLGGDQFWEYYDPNTIIKTGHGACEITVNPFSKSHPAIQIADNPKTLIASAKPVEIGPDDILSVSVDIAAKAYNNNPHEIWDAFITFNLFDFESGIVLDFLLNGHLIYALYERLYIPGLTDEQTAVTREANLPVNTEPGKIHNCIINYDRKFDTALWIIDGQPVYRVPNIPVKVNRFHLGMGLMTLKPIRAPFPYYFPKSTSLHGQGISGVWADYRVGLTKNN